MVRSERLDSIPGIGPKIAKLLNDVGISRVIDLKQRDPERLYHRLQKVKRRHIDRCVLYTFRCAVYYASNTRHDASKLKWWNWMDKK
jgi:nucleotidyltransferase/DNA polymerase involved in DNA repair